LCHTDHIAITINKYKTVHTGANIQSGGVIADLFNDEYQGSFELIVEILPIKEAEYVIIVNKKNDINLFFNIKVLYNSI
tara:strand:- start:40 stop:276 length:237 start_codon:yes stop_codon:yes gene_type:complete